MPFGHQTVGEHLKVWTTNNGAKVHNEAFLVAHAGQRILPNSWTKFDPQTTVHFFTPHGQTLVTPLADVLSGDRAVVQTVLSGGRCHDYELSKSQGYHQRPDTWFGLINKAIDKFSPHQRGVMYDTGIRTAVTTYGYDLITVRYRPFKIGTTLSASLTSLRTAGYNYAGIYCVICRG